MSNASKLSYHHESSVSFECLSYIYFTTGSLKVGASKYGSILGSVALSNVKNIAS